MCVTAPYGEPAPVTRQGSAPATAWAVTAGGPKDDGIEGLAPLPDGGAVVVGRFIEEVAFANIHEKPDLSSSRGLGWFLARIGPNGTPAWLRAFPDTATGPRLIAADPTGRIFVAGQLDGELALDDFRIAPATGQTAIFLAELSGDGRALWVKGFVHPGSDAGDADAFPSALEVDPVGGIVLAGSFQPALDLGGILLSGGTPQKPALFSSAFDLSGSVRWAKRISSSYYTAGPLLVRLAIGDGRIAVAGWFGDSTDTIDFDGSDMAADVAILTLDYAGNVVWTLRGAGSEQVSGRAVSIGPSGDLGFFGRSQGSIVLGATPLDAPEGWLMYVGRTDAAGALRFARTFPSGGYGGIAPFGSDFVVATESASSARNLRMTGVAPDGSETFSVAGADGLYPVDLRASSGRLFLSGLFDGAIDLGSGRLDSHGCRDIVIARFGP